MRARRVTAPPTLVLPGLVEYPRAAAAARAPPGASPAARVLPAAPASPGALAAALPGARVRWPGAGAPAWGERTQPAVAGAERRRHKAAAARPAAAAASAACRAARLV